VSTAVRHLPSWHVAPRRAADLRLRPWALDDVAGVVAAEAALSPASLTARFFTGSSRFPAAYLGHLSTIDPDRWDAVVALDDVGRFVGWAEYARPRDDDSVAELGVLVVDEWQRRGLGTRLVRMLLPRAILSGIRTLEIDVEDGNAGAQGAVRSLFGDRAPVARDGGVLHYAVPLIHPVITGEIRD
jgi:RimJ/RimL family protein N-acetyltransferase